MNKRRTAIVVGLAALAGGCTITPRHQEVRVYERDRHVVYENDRHVVYETDAYEGYYYVRIVYLNGVPWYVDEDLHARPVPPHLRGQFRHASWVRSAPPRFSRDPRVRDGYALSRIVYINGAPYHVDDDRRVRPIPSRLRSRFAYESVAFHDRQPAYREREASPGYGGGDAFGRAAERVREPARAAPAASDRGRQSPPAYGFGDARGRVTEQARDREDVRPLPPADDRPRQERATGGGAFAQAAERVREQAVRHAPPPVQNVETRPAAPGDGRMESGTAAREAERMAPPVARQPDHSRPDRGQPQAAGNDRARGNAAANSHDRNRAGEAPGRKNGKGRGPAQDQEADSADERDDPPGRNRRRDD